MSIKVNNNLKKLRKERGLSQNELAKKCGVQMILIQKYEYGIVEMNVAKFENLVKICNGLCCKLSDLFTDEEFAKLVRKVQRKQRS